MSDDDLLSRLEAGFPPGPLPYRVGVAVSGGSDSLALLLLMHRIGKFELSAVTVNHGLRSSAASEAVHVSHICARLGVPHDIVEWQGWDGRGNLQDVARRNRYSMIAGWARMQGLEAVAVGHTRDDLAETFLMRLSRAAGVDGLAAMARRFDRDGMRFLRPLLSCGRAELQRYLGERKTRWVDDPSNDDIQFDRVRARQVMAALAPLGLDAPRLAQVAENLSEARDALAVTAADCARSIARSDAGDLIFDRTALSALPVELRRRLLAGALRFVASAEYPPRRDAMSDLLAAVAARENRTLHGCYVMVSDMTVRVTRELAAVATQSVAAPGPWDHRWHLTGAEGHDCEIRALGDAVSQCPRWRETGRPRASLLASPALWDGESLVAAPLADPGCDIVATTPGLDAFAESLIAH